MAAEVILAMNTAPAAIGQHGRAALSERCDRLLFEERTGKSHALNAAVALAQGEVCAFIDDDAFPETGWLRTITAPLLAHDRARELVGCGGPVTPRFPASGAPAWLTALIDRNPTFFLGPKHHLGANPIDYSLDRGKRTASPLGANCAYRREIFSTYQYDPRLGPNRDTGLRGGEDTAISIQLMRDGYRLRYIPDARVVHPVEPNRTTPKFALQGFYYQGAQSVRMRRAIGLDAELRSLLEARREMWAVRARWLRKTYKRKRQAAFHARLDLAFMRGVLDELRRPFGTLRPPR